METEERKKRWGWVGKDLVSIQTSKGNHWHSDSNLTQCCRGGKCVSYVTQLRVLICCWQFPCLDNKCNTENTIIRDSQMLVLWNVRLPSPSLMFCALFFRSCWLKKMLLSDITFAQIYTMIPYYNFRHDKLPCWLSRPPITWLQTFYLIFSSSSLDKLVLHQSQVALLLSTYIELLAVPIVCMFLSFSPMDSSISDQYLQTFFKA